MDNILSIIFPYRNRKSVNLKKSLDSLNEQKDKNFKVFLVDYGSIPTIAKEVEKLCSGFLFVEYHYCHTQFQPWNKSRALNSVIKDLQTEFCFVADVDMIFHPDFVQRAFELQAKDKTVYFQVGFLEADQKGDSFSDFKRFRKSTKEATGLSMFPVRVLQELRGFDEFYHFWGAEDTDMHMRIKNAGYEVEFYDNEVLLLHQWHPSYRSREEKGLTEDLQLTRVVQLNDRHLKRAMREEVTAVNQSGWGEFMTEATMKELEDAPVTRELSPEKSEIDHFLFAHLPHSKDQIIKVTVKTMVPNRPLKHKLKKSLGKKVPEYYSLKEINDRFLMHLISFYRDRPYLIKIREDLQSLELTIRF